MLLVIYLNYLIRYILMNFKLLVYFVLFTSNFVYSQNITLQELATISGFSNETSGIEKTSDGLFWTHNDSGGANEIYGFNSSGTLIRTITITNASNVDWEELAQSADGKFYVGDFGNNNNDRSAANGTPLRIYIIPNPLDILGSTVEAQILEFEYEDRNFSAPSSDHDFDMEAMFWWNDTLHLFNKIRSTSEFVKHYVLPAIPGSHTATLVESLNLCGSCSNNRRRITAADISPCGRYVILLARERMYLFNCFSGSKYLTTGNMREFSYTNTQKEAIVFDTYQDIYITDEKNGPNGGKFYYFSLVPYVFPAMELTAIVSCDSGNGSIDALATGGAPVLSYQWDTGESISTINNLTAGSYSLTVTDAEGCVLDTTLVVSCPLSINLLKLKASKLSEVVLLEWIAESSNNADTFEVQRSVDGSSFETIAIVNEIQNETNYSYADSDIIRTKGVYYKIRKIVNNKVSLVSNLVYVKTNFSTNISIYPNPATQSFFISGTLDNEQNLQIKVFDVLGKEVCALNFFLSKGAFKKEIDFSSYAVGVYTIQILSAREMSTVKLIKK
jgi:hypothetical protein